MRNRRYRTIFPILVGPIPHRTGKERALSHLDRPYINSSRRICKRTCRNSQDAFRKWDPHIQRLRCSWARILQRSLPLSLSLSLSLNAPSVLFSHQLHCLLSLSLSLCVWEVWSKSIASQYLHLVYCIFKFMGEDSDFTVQLQLWRRMPCFPPQRSVPIFQLLPCFFPFICLDMVKASFSCFFSLFYLALAFPLD
jgi:hypothetical protein